MEGKVSLANLAILDPTAKMVLRSRIWVGRYRGAASHRRDSRSDGQNSNLSKKKTQGRISLKEGWKHTIMKLGGIVDE